MSLLGRAGLEFVVAVQGASDEAFEATGADMGGQLGVMAA